MSAPQLLGYPRSDGRWGFRNHILLLPLHQALCNTAREIENSVFSAVAVSHELGIELVQ